jgi:hypothetical protein
MTDIDMYNRQFTDVVSLSDKQFTVSVQRMLQTSDPSTTLYDTGRRLFSSLLSKEDDLISSTPLEACYYWTLSCSSFFSGQLVFLSNTFPIRCKKLLPERLFPGDDSKIYDLSFLRHNTMYYADKKNNGKLLHPLADLFFISDDNELILVDITGGNKEKVNNKKNGLTEWIENEQQNIPSYKLKGVNS